MVKYIMLFKVEGSLRYLSHLELMKLFRQCFRRSQLLVVFSEGFNPHMKLSFALAKGVGLESEGELLELEVESKLDIKKVLKSVNSNLSIFKYIKVLKIKEKIKTNKSLTVLLKKAEYDIVFSCMDNNREEIISKINSFLSCPSILVTFKKKGIIAKDVKDDIVTYKLSKKNGVVNLRIITTCGSERTLRIELLIENLVKAIGFNGEYTIKIIISPTIRKKIDLIIIKLVSSTKPFDEENISIKPIATKSIIRPKKIQSIFFHKRPFI